MSNLLTPSQPLASIGIETYYGMSEKDFARIDVQLQAIFKAFDAAIARQDIVTATHLILLLPRFMIEDHLQDMLYHITEALRKRERSGSDGRYEEI